MNWIFSLLNKPSRISKRSNLQQKQEWLIYNFKEFSIRRSVSTSTYVTLKWNDTEIIHEFQIKSLIIYWSKKELDKYKAICSIHTPKSFHGKFCWKKSQQKIKGKTNWNFEKSDSYFSNKMKSFHRRLCQTNFFHSTIKWMIKSKSWGFSVRKQRDTFLIGKSQIKDFSD